MRVSELGICATPLAFVQFASGLQVTLGQCCLFSVNVLCGCYRCCCCFFQEGSWTPFLYLLAFWGLCGELGQISCPPPQATCYSLLVAKSARFLAAKKGLKASFNQLFFLFSIFLTNQLSWPLSQQPIRARGIIVKYLHRTKNTGKVSQFTCFYLLFQKKQVVGHNILGKVCNPTYHSYVAQNVWLLSIYQMKLIVIFILQRHRG